MLVPVRVHTGTCTTSWLSNPNHGWLVQGASKAIHILLTSFDNKKNKPLELLPHNWGTLQISWFAVYLKIAVLKSLWLNDSEQIVQSPWRPFLRFLATMIGSWWPVQARIIVALAHGFVFCCCEISMQSLYIVLESSYILRCFDVPTKSTTSTFLQQRRGSPMLGQTKIHRIRRWWMGRSRGNLNFSVGRNDVPNHVPNQPSCGVLAVGFREF